MGIVGSQIETKRIFSTSRVITCLKCCQFGIKNMDKLILLMKNWLDDLSFKCTSGPKSFEKNLNYENNMISENEKLIVDFNLFEED
jgi:hypothetical protein